MKVVLFHSVGSYLPPRLEVVHFDPVLSMLQDSLTEDFSDDGTPDYEW